MDSSPPFLSVLDSTSTLLKDLTLVAKNSHRKSMEHNTEMDLVMEVPDTPDRVSMMYPQSETYDDAERKMPSRSRGKLALPGRRTAIVSSGADDTENLFEKARIASLISKPQEPEPLQSRRSRSGNGIDSSRSQGSSSYGECAIEKRGKVNATDITFSSEICPSRCGLNSHLENEGGCGPSRRNYDVKLDSHDHPDCVQQPTETIDIDLTSARSHHYLKGPLSRSSFNGHETTLTGDLPDTTRKEALKPSQLGAHPRTSRRRLVHNGFISLNNVSNGKSTLVNKEAVSSNGGIGVHDKGKGVQPPDEYQGRSGKVLSGSHQVNVPNRKNSQRKLVRNGLISPFNIEKDVSDKMSRSVLPQVHILSPDSECCEKNKMKETKVATGPKHQDGHEEEVNVHLSNRHVLKPHENLVNESECIGDIVQPYETGWRSTRNCTGKGLWLSSHEFSVASSGRNDSFDSANHHCNSLIDDRSYGNTSRPCNNAGYSKTSLSTSHVSVSRQSEYPGSSITFELETDNRRHCESQRLRKGKRKTNSGHIHDGERSCSSFGVSEMQNLYLTGESSNANISVSASSQQHDMHQAIIDVDQLSSPSTDNRIPKICSASEDSFARAQQVESDEILARQLQEQFFNESPVFGGEEVDARIAWTLQQAEAAQGDSLRIRRQSQLRGGRQNPRQSSRSSFGQYNSRGRAYSSARMVQLWRNMRQEMDLEMRLDFLEAMEAEFDDSNDSRVNILQIQRDFNENDYEMLLSLDDNNNHHAGASANQINSLPHSVVQTNNVEETCAICLESPTIGDTIRHLPCLHKFHKDCIDSWLRRRTSCPICKSGIT